MTACQKRNSIIAHEAIAGETSPPLLSVVMSVYNGEADVALAIGSILAQTYQHFEFVIVDDGSCDNTPAILADFAKLDARIRVIPQQNTGLTQALRRGVEEARGQFIARMDADDISMPTRFAKQMAVFDAQPDLVTVSTLIEHFTDVDKQGFVGKVPKEAQLLPLYACFANPIGGHGQVIYRKSAYLAAGGYDPQYNLAEDYDLWTRMMAIGPFAVVNEALYRYRTGHDSVSSLNKGPQAKVSASVCRRQYKHVVGKSISQELALALRFFWWNMPPQATPLSTTMKSSAAMMRAARAFFAKNPELRHLEYAIKREIASRWRWRIKQTAPRDLLRKAVLLANTLHWWLVANVAKLRHGI